ncbi:hypothetical protein BDP27DRAFT_1414534 [Rhodocollybia butyracea]|uniref:GmrSD restriction endonucleases N-terminal domain-containing protein n=1 Tax=Rhodocollybia butyracea TaxID=206335 RepID=A0A9P5UEX7_9AGAR|nr:hypothetical protein BDP27DRAFT_1414534 [Rhodocollybia butyracea]
MERSSSVSSQDDELSVHRAASSTQANIGGTRTRGSTNVEFDMPKALKRPRDASYSVRSLYDDIKRGLIDVNPEYQRDVVWKMEKQMMLIDSVFTNHYMPPIIFSVVYDDNGTEAKKICLDGSNLHGWSDSLETSVCIPSLWSFLLIAEYCRETLKNWWYKADESSKKNIIPERNRTSFANRQIRCTEYEDLDEEDEREIFRRVQLGVALSSAEKLKVLNTRRAKFITELKELYVTEDGLAASTFRWERSRGADYRCLAQAVYVIQKWNVDNGLSLKNAGTLPQVEKWLNDPSESVSADLVDLIKKTFSILIELTVEYPEPFKMYPKVSPVEIIGVLVLIYAHSVIASPGERLSLPELAAAVSAMRRDVRKEHKDIRLNDRVGKTIIAFVKAYRKVVPPPRPAPVPEVSTLRSLDAESTHQRMVIDSDNYPQQLHMTSLHSHDTYSPKRKRDLSSTEQPASKRSTTISAAKPRAANTSPSSYSFPFPSGKSLFYSESTSAVRPSSANPGIVSHLARNLQMAPSAEQNVLPPTDRQYIIDLPYPAGYVGHTHYLPPPAPSPASSSSSSSYSDYVRARLSVVPPIAVKTEPPESPRGVSVALREVQQVNSMMDQQYVMSTRDRHPANFPRAE